MILCADKMKDRHCHHLMLVIKEARNMVSSSVVCSEDFGTYSLSSATVKAAFFPSFEDL